MGNEVSNSEVEEEQEGPVKKSNPEFAVEAQNGSVILQSSPALSSAPETNYVSSKQVIQQENMITSSQKTIVFSPISNGSVTTPPPPAAKSKFRLTISRPSPGRTSFQPNGKGDVGPMKQEITLQESPVVQTQLMTPIGPDTVVVKENGGGIQNQAPPSVQLAEDEEPSTKPKEDEEPPAKPKEVSFFQKIFKPEKKPSVQNEVTINEPVVIDVDQTAALQSSPPSDDLQSQSVDDYDQATSAQEQSSASEDTQNTPPAELHPVMSFFKTLVTPNKSVTKSEEEVKTEGEDKAKKDEQQTSGGKVVLEQSVVSVSVNSEKSPPDQVTILDPKTSDVPKQIIASEEEGKAAKESAVSRPKLFWRKSFKGEPQPNKVQENGVEEQATQPVSVNTTPEQIVVPDTKPPDSNAQPQENEKPVMEPSSRSVPFWRKSFKGDPQPRKNQDNVVVEQPVVSISVNSEKSSPEQALTPDTKPPDSDTQQPESEKPPKEAPTRPLPFWKKSFKADPPPQKVPENVVVEPPVVSVSVNSEKSSPEQVLTQDTKAPDSDTQQPESGRPQKEASARPLPFWRKSFKGDPQTLKAQENPAPEEPQNIELTLTSSSEPEPQSSKSNTGDKGATPGSKSPENKKQEDAKATKPKIMMFFKQLSVLGDGSNISPEESTEKSSQEPTLDITDGVEVSKNEKTVVTAVVEPPPPPPLKGKDAMKEKKASAEKLNKQESRESAEAAVSVQLQAPDPVQVDDKASRDGQLKRTEKRQSLGNFFKTIGMKRMCDAEVQTDPVTILPAEKTK
ncbi:breast carcinoma-amplified sequence 1 isoform X6 [Hyla sarda]|uniref:breast carcinoma-amplified sequence 1 isoform X6 n=1 Tax=Hyla sarda TaxID=327740 RepID=UPI0024C325F7|nr:breast carcinoma-amplified sequence 1 isoform X6 [Hyla sarda]